MFIDISDGEIKTPKLDCAVKGPYRVFGQDQHTVVFHCKGLAQGITADRVARASRPAGVPSISPDSASAMKIKNKNLGGTTWLFHGILDHNFKDDGQLEFLLNLGDNYEV